MSFRITLSNLECLSKNIQLHTAELLVAPVRGSHWEYCYMVWKFHCKKFEDMITRFDTIPERDRQQGGWTARRTAYRPHYAAAVDGRKLLLIAH